MIGNIENNSEIWDFIIIWGGATGASYRDQNQKLYPIILFFSYALTSMLR